MGAVLKRGKTKPQAECQGCRFWHALDTQLGECRRQPPRSVSTLEVEQRVIAFKGTWPRTFAEEWCGEFTR